MVNMELYDSNLSVSVLLILVCYTRSKSLKLSSSSRTYNRVEVTSLLDGMEHQTCLCEAFFEIWILEGLPGIHMLLLLWKPKTTSVCSCCGVFICCENVKSESILPASSKHDSSIFRFYSRVSFFISVAFLCSVFTLSLLLADFFKLRFNNRMTMNRIFHCLFLSLVLIFFLCR